MNKSTHTTVSPRDMLAAPRAVSPLSPRPRVALLGDSRGAVMTEYMVLVGTVGLVVAAAVATAGVDLIRRFEIARFLLMLPLP